MTEEAARIPAALDDGLPGRLKSVLPLLGFVLVTGLTLWPILSHLYLPLADLPNHVARHHILTEAAAGPLTAYYEARFAIVPNAAADFLWFLFADRADPVRFSQWVMAGYAVNLIAATAALSRFLHGRWSLWPLSVALVVFNANYFWGFQNFLTTVPFVIWGLLLWLALESRATVLRMAVFVPVAAALFFMHFFAFTMLAIATAGREMQVVLAASPGRRRAALGKAITLGLPFVLPLLWLLRDILTGSPGIHGSMTTAPSLLTFFQGFAGITLQLPAHSRAFAATGGVVLAVLILLFLSMRYRRFGRLALDPRMAGPVLALGLAALLAPFWLNGVGFVNIRAPFVTVALLIAGTRWTDTGIRAATAIALVVLALIGIRAAQVERLTALHDAETRDFIATLAALPEGARLLPARGPDMEMDARLTHLQAYAVVERQSYVPTLFQGVHMLQVREEWHDISHPQWGAIDIRRLLDPDADVGPPTIPQFWRDWSERYTHVALFEPVDPDLLAKLPLRKISQAGRFTLFEITGPT